MNTTVNFHRQTGNKNSVLRKMQIYVDGEKVDSIKNKESKVLTLSEGQHVIKAKIDWCWSNEQIVTLPAESNVHLELKSHPEKFPKFFGYLALFLLILGMIFPDSYLKYLALIPGSILFYKLTFGRKDFLLLEKRI